MFGRNHETMKTPRLLFTHLLIVFLILRENIRNVYGWVISSSTKSTTTTSRIKQNNDVYNTPRNQHLYHPLITPSRHNRIRHRRGSNSLIQRYVLAEDVSEDINNMVVSQSNTTAATTTTTKTNLLETLLLWFQGDFDNYRQVVIDRQNGLLPREYGGHEHIHCSLIPVSYQSRLAAFYFDGIPNAIFRFRFYNLQSSFYNHQPTVDTILYTLSNDLERKLRTCTDPMMWPEIFKNHVIEVSGVTIEQKGDDQLDIVQLAIQSKCVTLLPNCDVRWSWERDAIQHSYVFEVENLQNNDSSDNNTTKCGIHAVMVHGEALVDSQMIPGQKILIKDQLSLWEDQLWIHDRGFHPDTGAYIYGNQNEIPYRMQRVSYIKQYNDTSSRNNNIDKSRRNEIVVSDPEIAWTLGNNYRTQVEYDTNMERIGGSSRK
jgi:hypothetical protein